LGKRFFHAKRKAADIHPSEIIEPVLEPSQRAEYLRGWELFNAGEFWHAHEAWENIWKERPEPARIFFQGIIQLAAAYHLILVKHRYGGAMNNLEKADEKLRMFPTFFLGVRVGQLLKAIGRAKDELQQSGAEKFDRKIIPEVEVLR